jgi:hypothetical protein
MIFSHVIVCKLSLYLQAAMNAIESDGSVRAAVLVSAKKGMLRALMQRSRTHPNIISRQFHCRGGHRHAGSMHLRSGAAVSFIQGPKHV